MRHGARPQASKQLMDAIWVFIDKKTEHLLDENQEHDFRLEEQPEFAGVEKFQLDLALLHVGRQLPRSWRRTGYGTLKFFPAIARRGN